MRFSRRTIAAIFVSCLAAVRGGIRQGAEQPPLACVIREREARRPGRRVITRVELAVRIGQRQIELADVPAGGRAERGKPALDRLFERSRAGERPLVQHRQRQPDVPPARRSARTARVNASSSACMRASAALGRT